MAKDQVEEIKQKTDIVSIIGEYVDLKKAGSNFKGLCPFHSEKIPSFMVSPELQIYKCFGCNLSGDVYTFLQEYEGMDFVEALRFLASRAGVELKQTYTPKSNKKQAIFAVNKSASYFYNWILTNHPLGEKALNYLTKSRGLALETIHAFGLGFSPATSGALTSYLVNKKKFRLNDLQDAGLVYRKGRGAVDRFQNRVVFPLHDHRGNVIGFAGRTMPGLRSDLAKYINTPETQAYHKSSVLYGLNVTKGEIKRRKKAIVVEGELDLISPWQAGIKNIVAIKGSAFTTQQATLLARYTKQIVLAYDADSAGIEAAMRGALVAQGAELEVSVAKLTGSKDPDDLARKNPTKLKKILDRSIGIWDFLIETTISRHDIRSGIGKARASREVIPVLAKIEDAIVQAHYVKVVSDKLGVGEEAVLSQLAKSKSTQPYKSESGVVKAQFPERRDLLEARLLFLIFKGVVDEANLKVKLKIKNPLYGKLFNEYKKFMIESRKFNANDFVKKLPAELAQGFAGVYMKDERAGNTKEVHTILKELINIDLKKELDETAKEISKLEKLGQKGKLRRAQLKFKKVSDKISQIKES